MSDHAKKPEAGHAPSGINPMKDKEGPTLAESSKALGNTATTDKNKRESGKDKEQHKR
jgi:hypothetical protein